MAGVNSAAIDRYNRQLQQAYSNSSIANKQGQIQSLLQSSTSQNINQQSSSIDNLSNSEKQPAPAAEESVKVSSSIGKAAAKGQLTRAEAMAIYEKIASFL
ncbi:MAG TPA: hypothetical protein DCS87_10880 [Rheinheimera sp.]|nr:hypothetical protein [Rheinheimera sp.]